MDDVSQRKTLAQLAFCYASNRRAQNPVQLFITNLRGKTREMFLSRQGVKNWDLYFLWETLDQLWVPTDIVYLSPESENVLEVLDESKVYVIGGLLDHNHEKGLSHRIAIEKGYGHARLPIDENLLVKSRKVLTIDQVFIALLRVSSGTNWNDALVEVIPKRKGVEQIRRADKNDEQIIQAEKTMLAADD